jgi:exopolysaccharide biosynthesis polyprenyl glycosylphosphotransferase
MIQERQRIFSISLLVIDLVLTTISFLLAYWLRTFISIEGTAVMPIGVYTWLLWLMLPIWGFLLAAFGVFARGNLTLREQLIRVTKAVGLAWGVMVAVLYFADPEATSRGVAALTLLVNYPALVSYRLFLFAARRRQQAWTRHVAVIGENESAAKFARMMESHAEWGLYPIGVFPEAEARAVLERGGIDDMIFVVDRQRLDSCEEVFLRCEEQGVTVRVVLKLFPHSIARIGFHELDGYPLLTFSTTPSNEFLLFVRRILDIILSLVLLVPGSVVIGLAALAIRLTSPGPALFRQRRCGLHGRPFTMYKLRSMIDDAEQRRVELEPINEMDGPVFKSSRDPRITTVGRLLRRFSIDEFPQLFNVLRGDMSLVGPRPPLPAEVERYERWQRRRLSMKPGITCLWQISGRNQIGFDEWMRLDLNYIDNWSLLLDLKILLKTVPVVLLGRGAR